jgi:hypothetical protein
MYLKLELTKALIATAVHYIHGKPQDQIYKTGVYCIHIYSRILIAWGKWDQGHLKLPKCYNYMDNKK